MAEGSHNTARPQFLACPVKVRPHREELRTLFFPTVCSLMSHRLNLRNNLRQVCGSSSLSKKTGTFRYQYNLKHIFLLSVFVRVKKA